MFALPKGTLVGTFCFYGKLCGTYSDGKGKTYKEVLNEKFTACANVARTELLKKLGVPYMVTLCEEEVALLEPGDNFTFWHNNKLVRWKDGELTSLMMSGVN